MASAGCFLERRPLAASNLSRPPLSHPPSKRRTISTAMLLPPCQFSLSIEYTYTAHHLCLEWSIIRHFLISSFISEFHSFSFWNLEHLWTNETGQNEFISSSQELYVYPFFTWWKCVFILQSVAKIFASNEFKWN